MVALCCCGVISDLRQPFILTADLLIELSILVVLEICDIIYLTV